MVWGGYLVFGVQAGLEDGEEGLEDAEVDHLLRHVSVLEGGERARKSEQVQKGTERYR